METRRDSLSTLLPLHKPIYSSQAISQEEKSRRKGLPCWKDLLRCHADGKEKRRERKKESDN